MNYRILRAAPEDAAEVQALYVQLLNDPNIHVTADRIRAIESDERNILLVVKLRSRVAATALLTICQDVMYDDRPFAVLENIVVASRFQHRGLGQALMSHIKTRCKELRCTKIMLLSSATRSEAHSFFEKCGYQGSLKKAFVNYINRT